MVYTVLGAVSKRPQLAGFVRPWLFQAQIRFMYEQGRIWRQE